MPFEFGDVVLVPFPFTSQRASKKRPAIVVSSRGCSIARPDLIVMAVTSQLRSDPGMGDAWISRWQSAGLFKPSVIKRCSQPSDSGLCGAGSARSTMTIEPR